MRRKREMTSCYNCIPRDPGVASCYFFLTQASHVSFDVTSMCIYCTCTCISLQRFHLAERLPHDDAMTIAGVERRNNEAVVTVSSPNGAHKIQVKSGLLPSNSAATEDQFVHTPFHDQLLTDLVLSHLATDFCIIGPRVNASI